MPWFMEPSFARVATSFLSAAGSWCLVRVAASASAALTAAPGLRGQGASWSWTRWTKNKQPTLVPPRVTQPSSYR